MEVRRQFPGGLLVIDVQADPPTSMRSVSAQALLVEELADARRVLSGEGEGQPADSFVAQPDPEPACG